MEIRHATEADVPQILQFIKDLAEYERLADKVVATEEGLRRTLFGNPRFAEVVFAREDGVDAGFALFFHNYSTFLGSPGIYLEDLFVKPEFRGRGIGKQLLTYLATLAKERGCTRLEWAVLTWNAPAIEFYKHIGAAPMSDWIVFRLTGEELDTLALE
ncbi:MAG TPA: GNAT family N-acetyltransferase [Thermoanaerobaculia bacterium]|nr:GNAT family N-acetyltransferase [Thermoanaerobaculia bacterium]